MTEVDVKEISLDKINHDVVRMPVTKSKNIGGNTVARCRSNENLSNFLQSSLNLVVYFFL